MALRERWCQISKTETKVEPDNGQNQAIIKNDEHNAYINTQANETSPQKLSM